MTTQIATEFNLPIEEVASWPWQKRLTYQQAVAERNRFEKQQIDANTPNASNVGSVGTPERARDTVSRKTTGRVERHAEVIST